MCLVDPINRSIQVKINVKKQGYECSLYMMVGEIRQKQFKVELMSNEVTL